MTKTISARVLGDIIRLERDKKEIEKKIKKTNRKIFILKLKQKWNNFINKDNTELEECIEWQKKHVEFNRDYLEYMKKSLVKKLA